MKLKTIKSDIKMFFVCASVFFLLKSSNTLAQIPQPSPNIQSPNVATMELFGKIPVSYFTGQPSIQINENKDFNIS